ncbi:hypothetical protein BDQ12DRAFT_711862 [Crucibulum laeve]|uniref:Uncharacterized protein n=1 Tax=Crucibulum laeve TaxID=68775 RepID=A0A5C3M2Y1_9AGAR|nr:hypothetical protein BDQ12DRAFT_711862 [Crucibulum laeve]
MTDPASNRLSRAGSVRVRPGSAPLGPRIRNRTSLLETNLTSPLLSPSRASSPGLTSPVSPLASSPLGTDPPKQLPVISEVRVQVPPHSPSAPAYDEQPQMSPIQPVFKAIPKLAKLTTPTAIKFDSTPVQWKALPLEAALWTFNSQELQAIVSRAIRSSARESFIRLLSVDNLDKVLPAELERLNALKGMTQSKYRFLVHRRTMLLQALNSSSAGHSNKDGEDTLSVVSRLASQLSETTAECDQLVEDLMKISDQTAQITKMLDVHWASALAIALRKLNGSYGRRTTELSAAREKITQLQAELEDAWKEAERLAREMDEYDAAVDSDDEEEEAIVETAEIITVPQTPLSPRPNSLPLSPKLVHMKSFSSPPMSPTTPLMIPPPLPMKEPMRGMNSPADVPDTVSIHSTRSARSTKSHRSARGTDASRISVVSAAKKRSYRASQSSLRLPTHSRKSSIGGRPKTPYDDHDQPPVPNLPFQFTPSFAPSSNVIMIAPSANASSTLLHSDGQHGHTRHRSSLDGIRILNTPPSSFPYPTMDDIYMRHQTHDDYAIEIEDRVPPMRSSSMDRIRASTREVPVQSNIPSIWMHADAPKTPAERVESLMQQQNTKSTPYQKLRTLTKRYSLPFPMFSARQSGHRPVSRGSGGTGSTA